MQFGFGFSCSSVLAFYISFTAYLCADFPESWPFLPARSLHKINSKNAAILMMLLFHFPLVSVIIMSQKSHFIIPSSTVTVKVRIIDTTSSIVVSPGQFFEPEIKGTSQVTIPVFSFLVEHDSGRKVLFDLGVRKDWENLAPATLQRLRIGGWEVKVKKDVREQLEENGVAGKDIESIIWSHWHWDHVGDPATFDSHTALVVGPGFKDTFVPAYPTNKDAALLDSDFSGRELREISFDRNIKVGAFDAFDYFGDGSFYLLDSPGHAVGHLCGLARVSTSPDSFIFMGGDSCHHAGEYRPSEYLPLPSSISPHPFGNNLGPCPGSLFEPLLRDADKTKPFYVPRNSYNLEEAKRTIAKVQGADALDDVLVIMAHDKDLLGIIDLFPKYANDFSRKKWVETGRWAFLKDFQMAV